jgi:hypothetical protein
LTDQKTITDVISEENQKIRKQLENLQPILEFVNSFGSEERLQRFLDLWKKADDDRFQYYKDLWNSRGKTRSSIGDVPEPADIQEELTKELERINKAAEKRTEKTGAK